MERVSLERWLLPTYCLLLFAAGCIFGFIFTKDGQIGLVSFLGAMSSLATVGAAITAVAALNSWKAQFQLQKKYDAVISVRAFLHEASHPLIYLSSLSNHFSAYIFLVMIARSPITTPTKFKGSGLITPLNLARPGM